MSLCPESANRAAMSDGEFWDHVLLGIKPGEGCDEGPDIPDEIEMAELYLSDPCPECGATGACGYDDLGRPMIHAISKDGDA